jgi:hypothetical protein
MTRSGAFKLIAARLELLEALRVAIVSGCALTLIAAERVLPFSL